MRTDLGLDQPLPVPVGALLRAGWLQGDLGRSLLLGQGVFAAVHAAAARHAVGLSLYALLHHAAARHRSPALLAALRHNTVP